MNDETLSQAARRLGIIADDIAHRFTASGLLVAPLGLPNSIAAARLILDRLERETSDDRSKDAG